MTSPRLRSGNSILRKTPTSKQTSVAVSLHLLTLAYSYFAEIEQAAFTPSHTVDGWAPSADPVLQSRLFSYPDTHRHRLGVNYQQLPVNAPLVPIANFQRDGPATFFSQGARPNYQSSIVPLAYKPKLYESVEHEVFLGTAQADLSEITERASSLLSMTVRTYEADEVCAA